MIGSPNESDASEQHAGPPLLPPRRHQTERASAVVIVHGADGEREMPLAELLNAYAQDPDGFEQLGALKVGETITFDCGRTSVRRVR